MKIRLPLLLLLCVPITAQQLSWIGPFNPTGTVATTCSLAAADNRCVFVLPQFAGTKTDPTITVRVSTVTGTVAAGDVRISVLQSIAGIAHATATVANATDLITVTSHPFANLDAGVRVSFVTGGAMPSGVTEDSDYYACGVSGNTFQISTSSSCTGVVDITSDGTTVIVYRVLGSITNANAFTSATWATEGPITATLTAGEQYMYEFRNLDGAPTSNFPVLQYITTSPFTFPTNMGSVAALWGWAVRTGTTKISGSRTGLAGGVYVGYGGDGTKAGLPWGAPVADTNNEIYGTRRYGPTFTTPVAGQLRVQCIGSSYIAIVGTPGALIAELRDASHAVVATTNRVRLSELVSTSPTVVCFSTVQTLTANTAYSIVFGQQADAGDSSNKYRLANLTIPDASGARQLLWMYNGATDSQFRGDYFNASTWSQSTTLVPQVMLILAHSDPITAPAGGTGSFVTIQ